MNLDWKWYDRQCNMMIKVNMERFKTVLHDAADVGTYQTASVYLRSMMGPIITTLNQVTEQLLEMLRKRLTEDEKERLNEDRLLSNIRREYYYKIAEVEEFPPAREYVSTRFELNQPDNKGMEAWFREVSSNKEEMMAAAVPVEKAIRLFVENDIPALVEEEMSDVHAIR